MITAQLSLIAVHAATTYLFGAAPDGIGWAACTVNDETGELNIQSDWGNWAYRWSAHPEHLGATTLTAFIANRGDVDYIARKLQNEGRNGRRWSAPATVRSLRLRLCERRLDDARSQLENRLEPEDMPGGSNYTDSGLPIFSSLWVPEPRWNDRHHRERLPYLTRDTARQLWKMIGQLADCVGHSADRFYERVLQLDGFTDYVTEEPWEYGETAQTPQDKALREIVLPALIEACRARAAAPPAANP